MLHWPRAVYQAEAETETARSDVSKLRAQLAEMDSAGSASASKLQEELLAAKAAAEQELEQQLAAAKETAAAELDALKQVCDVLHGSGAACYDLGANAIVQGCAHVTGLSCTTVEGSD